MVIIFLLFSGCTKGSDLSGRCLFAEDAAEAPIFGGHEDFPKLILFYSFASTSSRRLPKSYAPDG